MGEKAGKDHSPKEKRQVGDVKREVFSIEIKSTFNDINISCSILNLRKSSKHDRWSFAEKKKKKNAAWI